MNHISRVVIINSIFHCVTSLLAFRDSHLINVVSYTTYFLATNLLIQQQWLILHIIRWLLSLSLSRPFRSTEHPETRRAFGRG